jgi:hypothetical protein
MDIIFVEEAASLAPPSVKGVVVAAEERAIGLSHPTMTHNDLIDKIFSSEHIIVV